MWRVGAAGAVAATCPRPRRAAAASCQMGVTLASLGAAALDQLLGHLLEGLAHRHPAEELAEARLDRREPLTPPDLAAAARVHHLLHEERVGRVAADRRDLRLHNGQPSPESAAAKSASSRERLGAVTRTIVHASSVALSISTCSACDDAAATASASADTSSVTRGLGAGERVLAHAVLRSRMGRPAGSRTALVALVSLSWPNRPPRVAEDAGAAAGAKAGSAHRAGRAQEPRKRRSCHTSTRRGAVLATSAPDDASAVGTIRATRSAPPTRPAAHARASRF